MALVKRALCDIAVPLNSIQNNESQSGFTRTAAGKLLLEPNSEQSKIVESEIKKHPTALFFRSKAIKADEPNSNGDYFSEAELIRSHKSFEGVPFFTNHNNQNVENARGKIIFAEWVPEEKSIYTISFVDREAFPHICRSIEEEYITGVSMGFLGMDADIIMSDLSTKKICDVSVGDKVLTPMGNSCEVKKIYTDIVGTPMYELDLVTYHKSPLLSSEHPLYIIPLEQIEKEKKSSLKTAQANKYLRNKNKIDKDDFVGQNTWRSAVYSPEFRETAKCQKGDCVLIPSKYKVLEKKNSDKDFWYLAGAYVGDGYLSKSNKKDDDNDLASLRYYIGLHEKKELGKRIEDLLPKYTKSRITKVEFPLKNGLSIGIYDRDICTKLFNNFGKLAHHKRIYKNDFSKEEIVSFISGYIDTDGTVARNYNKKQNGDIRGSGVRGVLISSCNRGLLEDVQSLLISIDVPSYITWNQRFPNKNSVVKVPTLDFSLFIAFSNMELFSESIKVRDALKEKPISKNDAGKVFIFTSNMGIKYMACPIKDIIEKQYDKPCYDLKIEGDESYIADGVAVHNCSVEYSVCNICGNRAEKTEDYCTHIRERKGRTFSGKARDVKTGETKEFKNHPVFEYNYGIKFIELSAVVDPACPSCRIEGLIQNDEILKKVANLENSLHMIKTAAIMKEAGKEEVDQLNTVLKTLEDIAVQLIKNRQQIEVEFASDLVNILSELQIFVEELVGAGYGNVQSQAVPGTAEAPPAPAPQSAPGTLSPQITETASPSAIPPPPTSTGTVSGAPGAPLAQKPKLPITAPIKPRASDTSERMVRAASTISNLERLRDRIIIGEDMAKRRTLDNKLGSQEYVTKTLSNSWQEKQDLFEYIDKVPSLQDNVNKLSVKKRDDTFIIVAENKNDNAQQMTWTYEDLNRAEKDLIKGSPKDAASYFLETFANNLKPNIKGETVMSNTKEAGAKSVNKTPEVVQESQLDTKGLYHSRTNDEPNVVTEKQLSESRTDGEKEVTTEAQLAAKSNKLNPRTEAVSEVTTEAQLEAKKGASPRTEDVPTVITQKQLDGNRTGTEPEVITERQLDSIDAPWERAANRDAKLFKSAGEHMDKVIDVLADVVISTGCTAEEACQVGSSLLASTKDRVELNSAILSGTVTDDVDHSKRLAYWSKKNIKLAGAGVKDIAKKIIGGLQKVASDVTMNPEVVMDALDVVSEGQDGEVAISKKVDEKLALASKEVAKVSKKDELRNALKASVEVKKEITSSSKKATREAERAILATALSASEKNPDHMIETSFQELGVKKTDPSFKSAIKSFARGALASQNMKLASVTNVTISGDTISIAVQTDEGEQSVEVPIGEEASPSDTLPEGDLTGEGLENTVGGAPAPAPAPASAPAPAGLPTGMASSKSMKKVAQTPSGAGIPGTPGGVSAPGAPEQGLPGGTPGGEPVQALTQDESTEMPDEIPTAGEQQPPWAICPECGSSDSDVTNEEAGGIKGTCNACGAEYEALVKKEIEFKITKPTKSVGKDDVSGAPEAPEVPALPVAAQAKLTKDVITRIASNKAKHGHVCPSCGMKQCKASVEESGHVEYKCPACNTDVEKDFLVNVNKPDEGYHRVAWDLVPKVAGCPSCKESVAKFASLQKVQKMIKSASEAKFPKANCMQLVAKKWGGNAVALTGPCKGKPLADCVCGTLEKLGLTKVRHLEKLATVLTEKDPMDVCIEEQVKEKGFDVKEASTICKCLKKKFASKADDNIFIQAFMDDVENGKETGFNATDLDTMNDLVGTSVEAPVEEAPAEDMDMEISDAIPTEVASETVSIELPKEVAEQLVEAIEVEVAPIEEAPVAEESPVIETPSSDVAVSDVKSDNASSDIKSDIKSDTEENEMAIANMQVHKILRVGETVIKVAATPTKVDSIEGNVEAKVPRKEQYLGEEAKADSMINKTPKAPVVPRKDAYMGKEKEADSMINKELRLPDVAVDSSYMGQEQANQKGMPAINNEIKGTVIATKDSTVKEAKKMTVVDTVEKEVESKVPRAKATIGNEGADNIDVKLNDPKVPRAKATMGEEGADNIDVKMDGPDVPIDSSYMGDEKAVQKDMPGISDKMLKNVASKEVQLERIATARRMKAVEVTAKLLATKRIPEGAYENVIEALSRFEIDKISSVAESMYPMRKQASTETSTGAYSGPVPVMESKEIRTASSVSDFQKKLENSFTIGSASFDKSLTQYGEK